MSPGYKADPCVAIQVRVNLDERSLTISGQRRLPALWQGVHQFQDRFFDDEEGDSTQEEDNQREIITRQSERTFRQFRRKLLLSWWLDVQSTEAKIREGVLVLVIMKYPKAIWLDGTTYDVMIT